MDYTPPQYTIIRALAEASPVYVFLAVLTPQTFLPQPNGKPTKTSELEDTADRLFQSRKQQARHNFGYVGQTATPPYHKGVRREMQKPSKRQPQKAQGHVAPRSSYTRHAGQR